MKPFAAIILLCTLAAVAYGVVHDQITARICVEYFTIGHPPVFNTDDPTLLGLGWGVIATWWVGAGLGLGLAIAARVGRRPKVQPRTLVRPLLVLLGAAALLAAISAPVGYLAAANRWIVPADWLADRIPEERHVRFLMVGTIHTTSYAAGALGGLVLIARTWRSRGPRGRGAQAPHDPAPRTIE